MLKFMIIIGISLSRINSTPIGLKQNMQIQDEEMRPVISARSELAMSTLNLPSNATSIRADLVDNFSCEDKGYGYYADIDNDCQIFHVCLPVVYPDGKENLFRWSFICPEETVFSQDSFTCMRAEDMAIGCEDSVKYYELNRNFGMITDSNEMNSNEEDMKPIMSEMSNIYDTVQNDNNNDEEEEEQMKKAENIPVPPKPIVPVKRKPVKKTEIKQRQPVRRTSPKTTITTTTTTLAPRTTEPKITEIFTSKPLLEQIPTKYQRFTKRPEIPGIKRKPDNVKPSKTELKTFDEKRKRPQFAFNTKRIDIQDKEKPLPLLVNVEHEEPKIVMQSEKIIEQKIPQPSAETTILLDDNVEKITQNKDLIMNNADNNVPFTVIMTETNVPDVTESLIIINKTEKPIPIKTEEEQQQEEELKKNAESLIISDENTSQINNKKESMTQDTNKNSNNINNDQQSMIINLISSLVNAENSKIEDEKILNSEHVQIPADDDDDDDDDDNKKNSMVKEEQNKILTQEIPAVFVVDAENKDKEMEKNNVNLVSVVKNDEYIPKTSINIHANDNLDDTDRGDELSSYPEDSNLAISTESIVPNLTEENNIKNEIEKTTEVSVEIVPIFHRLAATQQTDDKLTEIDNINKNSELLEKIENTNSEIIPDSPQSSSIEKKIIVNDENSELHAGRSLRRRFVNRKHRFLFKADAKSTK